MDITHKEIIKDWFKTKCQDENCDLARTWETMIKKNLYTCDFKIIRDQIAKYHFNLAYHPFEIEELIETLNNPKLLELNLYSELFIVLYFLLSKTDTVIFKGILIKNKNDIVMYLNNINYRFKVGRVYVFDISAFDFYINNEINNRRILVENRESDLEVKTILLIAFILLMISLFVFIVEKLMM